jgi:integrase
MTFPTKGQANDWLTTEKAKFLSGVWLDPTAGKVLFSQLADRWLTSNPGKRQSTLARDEIVIRHHLNPILGKLQISSITPIQVQDLINTWSDSQAPATCHRQYDVLRAIFNYAADADFLPRTPCRRIRLPEVILKERLELSPQNVLKIASEMPTEYELMVWLGVVVGSRWGEVAAVKVGSFNFERRSIVLDSQVVRGKGGKSFLGPPKSRSGTRAMAIPDSLVQLVLEHIKTQQLDINDPNAYLFTNRNGEFLDYPNFRRRVWNPAVVRAGIPSIGFHDLRRTTSTAMVEENVDLKTAMKRLGHSDPRMTLAIYAQATSEGDRAAAQMLGEKFLAEKITKIDGARNRTSETYNSMSNVARMLHAEDSQKYGT